MTSRYLCALLCLALAVPAATVAGTETYHLEIGDPERSSIERDLVIDGIVDTRTGDVLSPKELAARGRTAWRPSGDKEIAVR